MNCPSCGTEGMQMDTRDVPYMYKGRKTVIPAVTAEFCRHCDEYITSMQDAKTAMAKMVAFRKQVDAEALTVTDSARDR
jgi:HTH-type transcriptional regulator/antitoxin MqsA